MSTYTLISSQVLGSSAASITFSSIPQTYKDLCLKWSARGDGSSTIIQMNVQPNLDTASNYSAIQLRGNGSAASSSTAFSNTSGFWFPYFDGATATANTFGNGEAYIPNYTANSYKQASSFVIQENNITTAYISTTASLWRNNAAITSLVLTPTGVGGNFISGSSFYLYGI
jgi:hypothetical protein